MVKLQEVLILLARNEVDFVNVGVVAATLHGSAYATFDLDLVYSREPPNVARLANALAPCHPELREAPAELPFVWDAATLRNGLNFTLTTDLGDLDLLGELAGIGGFAEVKARSAPVDLFGRPFAVLSLDGLIAAKRAAGRPKDLLTLPELEALREAQTSRE